MKLASFSVFNYRSIVAARKINLSDYSVLVGANNEGKSNILHALALAMEALESFKYSVRRDSLGRLMRTGGTVLGQSTDYSWRRDFPISKQTNGKKNQYTEVILEFQLSDQEKDEFKAELDSKINQVLRISVKFYENNLAISVVKQGPGGATLTKKANRVAEYVSRRIQFEYIPAIRTSENAQKVIYDLLEKEISKLQKDPEYVAAIERIDELQKPILDDLAKTVQRTVSAFLPSVSGVQIRSPKERRSQALSRAVSIEIDDGNKTSLDRKGDGVKSLVALALMRHSSDSNDSSCASIVAIEEPEAHLHPNAIHELRDVLIGLSVKRQVVLTTHSPQFIRPNYLHSTIIVEGSVARPAKAISEIRETLGVRLSDNLQSARLVLVVEGVTDVTALSAILEECDPSIKAAIKSGDLIFDELKGAGKLPYKLSTYKAALTMIHVFLDGDSAGRERIKAALDERLISDADYNLAIHPKKDVSELEDLYNIDIYADAFKAQFSVDLRGSVANPHKKKWSEILKEKFAKSGKLFEKDKENDVKIWMANFAKVHCKTILGNDSRQPIDNLAASIKAKLNA